MQHITLSLNCRTLVIRLPQDVKEKNVSQESGKEGKMMMFVTSDME